MSSVQVQILGFEGCPLKPRLERELDQALAMVGEPAGFRIERVDVLDPGAPEDLRRWGSPTLLIDGRDVMDGTPGEAAGCRVYDTAAGVPEAATIAGALRRARAADDD